MPRTVRLHTPISEKDVRELRIDDVVYITGEAYSMLYADHYTLIMDLVKNGESLPMDLKDGVIYNTGTIYTRTAAGGYDLRALGTTTSSKFNEYTPEFIRLTGIRAVLGKGGMDRASLEAMKEYGCVYLALAGGCSAVYTPAVELEADYWPELMPVDNQRLKFRMKGFGPLFVAMDAHGNSIFEDCARSVRENLQAIYQKLGIDVPLKEEVLK